MKKRKIVLLAAAAAGIAYSAAEGKGIFNKVRFKKVHEAVSAYVNSHYTNAFYSPISTAGKGYITTITHSQGKVMLYITPTEDGVFIFHEELL